MHGSSPSWRLAALGLLAIGIMVPVTIPVPVLRELVLERFEVSELATSLFMSINMLGALVAAPLAGALADRWGRRREILVGALLADGLCFFALTAPVPFHVFMAIRFAEGCAHISALSILLTLASQALPPEHRGRAMGLVGGSMMLGVALGAPIGGVLGRGGALLPLQAGGGLLLAAALFAVAAAREVTARDERPGLRDIVTALRAHPAVLVPLIFAFADRFTVGFFTTTFSLYLRRIYELSSAQIGFAIAIFMIPFALLSYPFGQLAERRSPIALLCWGSLLYGTGTALVGFVAPPTPLFALMFTIGIAAAVMFVPSLLMTIQLVPDSIRATALGAFNGAGSLGFVLGPIAGGAISQLVAAESGWLAGYRAAFAAAGASEVLCVIVALSALAWLRAGRAGDAG
ncbi:MAG: MFS transporter [Myxococcota bacterium]